MFAEKMKKSTKEFGLCVIRVFQALPGADEARVIGKQALRSATSVAANYRAACRARSAAAFASKINVVLEEADETQFWLEMLEEAGKVPASRLVQLHQEAAELTAILTVARKNAIRKKAN
ncbi:four helix bundle protein [Pontibacter ramchanderi]|uniref:Four helix bundle protein n=1 Tax=Pontibacter ramchanderi TaxID=1179743 RepID=A0A2N3U9N6_9BACT|nr:four helix bundle protein [Pontibacter ramchanderi]PKV63473.1 four helix bundle protein [Pontibacter ramchanderi]